MKVFYNNTKKDIKNLVQEKAKYQKVMVLFDETIGSFEVNEIYEGIRDICVYNQININNLDKNEIYNGYRLIIYLCSVDNFIKNDFDKSEFINVFLPRENDILPFYISINNEVVEGENYLLLNENQIDFAMLPSVLFNRFYNYFFNLIQGEHNIVDFSIYQKEISKQNILNSVNELDKNFMFLDFKIIKQSQISYKLMIFVDLLIIDAFLVFLTSLKNNQLMLVDVYKTAKEDDILIEKFYKLYNNEAFFNLILLNYNCLYNYCVKTKEKILDFIKFFNIDSCELEMLINKIKTYAKNDKNLMGYLYLFNIFNV